MIAIIETGAKQYQVKKGDRIEVEKLPEEAGKDVEFSQVLLVADDKEIKIGKPYVEKAKVVGKVLKAVKGPKLIAYKYVPRENVRKKKGHRQQLSLVEIVDIVVG